MPAPLPVPSKKAVSTVHVVFEEDAADVVASVKPTQGSFLKSRNFSGKAGQLVVLPEDKAMIAWFGLGPRAAYTPLALRALPPQLPKGRWTIQADAALDRHAMHVAWGLGAYTFTRYRQEPKPIEAVLDDSVLDDAARTAVAVEVKAHALARDLVNTPANDMGPAELEDAVRAVAIANGATVTVTSGQDLISGYPAVYAVGKAAEEARQPRFIELNWDGDPRGPVIVLVGKGVVFDTGGLDIKPSSGMGLMKKDMGGAAHALALAQWIMEAGLGVRLRLLIPAVENAISGGAFRPGDVIASRAGLTIEIGNTDAEGRLILADALTRAGELEPALTVDFATLTGAARVALGPEVVPFYCADEGTARQLEVASIACHDPLWRMPLWPGYAAALESDIADIRNDPASWAQAGSVTAALFLQRFAPKTGSWAHFDIFAWNPRSRPGFPVGAEAQVIRAVYQLIDSYA